LNIGLFKVLILFKVLEINSQEYLFLWWSLAPGLLFAFISSMECDRNRLPFLFTSKRQISIISPFYTPKH